VDGTLPTKMEAEEQYMSLMQNINAFLPTIESLDLEEACITNKQNLLISNIAEQHYKRNLPSIMNKTEKKGNTTSGKICNFTTATQQVSSVRR
jgi:hypothetical protein